MEWLIDADVWIGFVTLLALEIVLGIDNVVFISILAGKLPAAQQARARQIGLGLALVMRILLLLTLSWVISLTSPLFSLIGHEISGRDLILVMGGCSYSARAPTRSTTAWKATRGMPPPGSQPRSRRWSPRSLSSTPCSLSTR